MNIQRLMLARRSDLKRCRSRLRTRCLRFNWKSVIYTRFHSRMHSAANSFSRGTHSIALILCILALLRQTGMISIESRRSSPERRCSKSLRPTQQGARHLRLMSQSLNPNIATGASLGAPVFFLPIISFQCSPSGFQPLA